jgi:5'-methylthioadenosine phosphorylase
MKEGILGIIGGSGLYDIEELTDRREERIETPFGAPSDAYQIGRLFEREVIFLPRHGVGHRLLPTELNYCANIYGFKKLGASWVLGVSAVGSLREELKPTDIVIPDQFVDRTNRCRRNTFFGDGIVAHISFGDPLCPSLRELLVAICREQGLAVHDGGTYVNMEGPAFSTRAESNLYRSWGMDVIGMTNLLEAKLSREAELCYASMALVTDYDCWHMEEVSVEMILENLGKNVENAKKLIKALDRALPEKKPCGCGEALRYAIVTAPDRIPAETKETLAPIIGKYIS